MLASESDYVLETFFPKQNEEEGVGDYYNELLNEELADKNKYDTFNIKYTDNDNDDIEEDIEIVDETKPEEDVANVDEEVEGVNVDVDAVELTEMEDLMNK